jgi:hypothetical protein
VDQSALYSLVPRRTSVVGPEVVVEPEVESLLGVGVAASVAGAGVGIDAEVDA